MAEHSTIGEHLLAVGAVTEAQIARIVAMQQSGDKRLFGQIANELGYLSEKDLVSYLQSVPNRRLRSK